jgi:hypothetical protein
MKRIVAATFVIGAFALWNASSAEAAKKTKMKYAEAKKACLKKDSDLTGKALQSCIKKMQRGEKRDY